MRRFWKIFYHLLNGKSRVNSTLPLGGTQGYKIGEIDQTQVSYCSNILYLAWLSWTKLCCKKLCAASIFFMSEQPAPSDSSNPKFIFRTRMTAMNPAKLSELVTSVDQDTKEVVEVESEVEEILSTPNPTTWKGK